MCNFYCFAKIPKYKRKSDVGKSSANKYKQLTPPDDLKWRPIIEGPPYRLSNILDFLQKSFLKHTQSYIQDDLEMLNHLPKVVNIKLLLYLMLSINIQTFNMILDCCLDSHRSELPARIEKRLYFLWPQIQKQFFTTTKHQGTAMGTKVASQFINLIMRFHEQTIYSQYPLIFVDAFHTQFRTNRKR